MIKPPENCPSCNALLEWANDLLYCRNLDCPAKSFKQLEHFAKTLKIKGLGPAAIEKLDIYTIPDIYDLTLEYMSQVLGEKTASKIFEEIEKSKNEPLNTVLPAFGIPLISKSISDKLSKSVESIFYVSAETCKAAGLGPKATENLLDWIENRFDDYCHLPFSFEFSNETKPAEGGEIVCITGKLSSYPTKEAATKVLQELGYTVKSTLTKDVTLLVNESGRETAKTIEAANRGVRIITNLKQYMENN